MESKLEILCRKKDCSAIHILTKEDFQSVVKTDAVAVKHNKQAEEDYKREMEDFKAREKEVKKQYKILYKGVTFTRIHSTGLFKKKKEIVLERYTLVEYSNETYIHDKKERTNPHHIYRPSKKPEKNELYFVCPFCEEEIYFPFNKN